MQILETLGLKNIPKHDKIYNFITFGLVVFVVIYSIVIYYQLPDRIPTHFDLSGEIDGYGSRSTFLVLGCITVFLAISFLVLSTKPQLFNYPLKLTDENKEKQYELAVSMLRQINTLVTLFMVYIIVSTSLVAIGLINLLGIEIWLMFLLLAGLAYIIGNHIFQSNKYA